MHPLPNMHSWCWKARRGGSQNGARAEGNPDRICLDPRLAPHPTFCHGLGHEGGGRGELLSNFPPCTASPLPTSNYKIMRAWENAQFCPRVIRERGLVCCAARIRSSVGHSADPIVARNLRIAAALTFSLHAVFPPETNHRAHSPSSTSQAGSPRGRRRMQTKRASENPAYAPLIGEAERVRKNVYGPRCD